MKCLPAAGSLQLVKNRKNVKIFSAGLSIVYLHTQTQYCSLGLGGNGQYV